MEQYSMVIHVPQENQQNTVVIHIHSGMDIAVYAYRDIGH
jgi:hypothetical protein